MRRSEDQMCGNLFFKKEQRNTWQKRGHVVSKTMTIGSHKAYWPTNPRFYFENLSTELEK